MYNKTEKIKKIISYLMIITIILLITYLNFKKLKFIEDPDVWAEINYGKEIWKTKSLFPNSWIPATELMFFRPAILYALFYGLTKKYILSYSISLTITLALIIWSYIYMLKAYKYKSDVILPSIVLLLSFGGEFRPFAILNFLLYGYYGFYTITTFLIIGFIQRIYSGKKMKKYTIVLIFIMDFISGISGVRMLIFLYIPLLITLIFNRYISKNAEIKTIEYGIYLVALNILGILLSKIFFSNTIIFKSQEVLTVTKFSDLINIFYDNISSILYSILGWSGGMEIQSAKAFDMLFKGILFLFVILFIYKNKKKYKKNIVVTFFMIYLIIIFGIKTLIYSKISNGFYWYYYLMPCLFSFLICDIIQEKKYKNKIFYLIVAIFFSNIFANDTVYLEYKKDNEINVITDYLKNNNIEEVATFFNLSGKIWPYSEGKIKIGHWYESIIEINDIKPFYWLGNSSVYNFKDVPTIVVLSDDQEKRLFNNLNSKLHTSKAEKIFETKHYKIYKFDINPLAELRIPRRNEELEFPPARILSIDSKNGYTEDKHSVNSKGLNGFVFYGPYIEIKKGIYNIELYYETTSLSMPNNAEIGYFDIISHNDDSDMQKITTTAKEKIIFNKSNNKVILKNVIFSEKNNKNVEFRVYGYQGYKFKIYKMKIKCIK